MSDNFTIEYSDSEFYHDSKYFELRVEVRPGHSGQIKVTVNLPRNLTDANGQWESHEKWWEYWHPSRVTYEEACTDMMLWINTQLGPALGFIPVAPMFKVWVNQIARFW